jgi:hypothetical protein
MKSVRKKALFDSFSTHFFLRHFGKLNFINWLQIKESENVFTSTTFKCWHHFLTCIFLCRKPTFSFSWHKATGTFRSTLKTALFVDKKALEHKGRQRLGLGLCRHKNLELYDWQSLSNVKTEKETLSWTQKCRHNNNL